MSCDKAENRDCEISDDNTAELPTDLLALNSPDKSEQDTPEIPDLIQFSPSGEGISLDAESNSNGIEINPKLVHLFKSIMNVSNNETYIREQLKLHDFSDKDLMAFLQFINDNDGEESEVDLSR